MNLFKVCKLYFDICKKAKVSAYRNPKLPESFWYEFDKMASRLKVNPADLASVINSESGFNPAAVNYVTDPNTNKPRLDSFGKKIPQAKGLNQLIKSTAKSIGMPDDVWNKFETMTASEQLPWVEKFFQKANISGLKKEDIYLKNFGGYSTSNPNKALYVSKSYMQAHPEMEFPNAEYQSKAYEQNRGLDKDNKGYISKQDLTSLVA